MPLGRTLMVQGTASSVGKSLLVTALCRLFARAGVRVAPFKAQNMSLNAAVAVEGGEVGRAQAAQAEAAGVPLSVDMNPVLLKPEGEARSQLIVLGRPRGHTDATRPGQAREELAAVIAGALDRLRRAHDLVVIEGAGSPVEMNLKAHDLANMHVARLAEAPVLLAADIDRGGVFASLVGTWQLLEDDERKRIAGFVVNKFRGERALLEPGLEFLEARTGVPVLGVLPFIRELRIAEEDSVSLEDRRRRPRPPPGTLDIAVVCLPSLSNQDDFDPLEAEPGVQVRFVDHPEALAEADLVVLPGSKTTVADLGWLRDRRMEAALRHRAARGQPVLGICGGCQMLGEEILDPDRVESHQPVASGLGLLPLRTRFTASKLTAVVDLVADTPSFLSGSGRQTLRGYEIHAGVAEASGPARRPAFAILRRQNAACRAPDGAVSGAVVGTMVHGLLANDVLRADLLASLRSRRGWPQMPPGRFDHRAEYDRLADIVQAHLDWQRIRDLALA